MVFPTSNLPTASQPWGREIQKQLVNAQTTIAANDINNSARDVQLQANFNRVNSAALKAQAAIDEITGVTTNIYVDGTTNIDGGAIQTGTVDANKLKATDSITLTNATGSEYVQFGHQNWGSGTSQPGTVGGNTTAGDTYFVGPWTGSGGGYGTSQNGVTVGSIAFGNAGPSLQLFTQTSPSVTYNAKLQDTNGGSVLLQSGVASMTGYRSSLNADGTNISVSVNALDNSASVYAPGGTATITGSTINLTGNIPSLSTSNGVWTSTALTNTSGYIQCADTYNRNVQAGRIMYVSSAGTYNCATSSARYKQDIADYKVDLEKFLKLQPVTFRYKQAVAEDGDNAKIASGFIAEQADEVGMGQFVDYEPDPEQDGKIVPDNFRYLDFAAAMHSALAQQQEMIKALTARIEILENK